MKVLLDTNILTRLAQKGHPHHPVAQEAVLRLEEGGDELCLVPQVVYEYWVVATRPVSGNGLGMPPRDVDRAIDHWLDVFTLLRDERNVFNPWRELVRQHDVKGKNAHDARLVAAMLRHGLRELLTFNDSDFARFSGIAVVTPEGVTRSRG